MRSKRVVLDEMLRLYADFTSLQYELNCIISREIEECSIEPKLKYEVNGLLNKIKKSRRG